MKRSYFTHKNGSKNMLDCATEKVTLLSDKSIKMLQKGATAQTQCWGPVVRISGGKVYQITVTGSPEENHELV